MHFDVTSVGLLIYVVNMTMEDHLSIGGMLEFMVG